MLTIKNRIMLLKLKKLVHKRNQAFIKGDYAKATQYGKMINQYITDTLKLEEGMPL